MVDGGEHSGVHEMYENRKSTEYVAMEMEARHLIDTENKRPYQVNQK